MISLVVWTVCIISGQLLRFVGVVSFYNGTQLPRKGYLWTFFDDGARCSSVIRAFAHGAMGRRIDLSWGGPIELFLVPASAPRLV